MRNEILVDHIFYQEPCILGLSHFWVAVSLGGNNPQRYHKHIYLSHIFLLQCIQLLQQFGAH